MGWGLGFREETRFGVSGFGFRVSGAGCRVHGREELEEVQGFGLRVTGFRFRVSGFGFRVSGLGLRVSGVGFRVLGFGFRVRANLLWTTRQVGQGACHANIRRAAFCSTNGSSKKGLQFLPGGWSYLQAAGHVPPRISGRYVTTQYKSYNQLRTTF
jgi:hypothetical protein